MATVGKIVARALRLIQVIDARQPVKAADMETAIQALNAMLRRWEADGLSLGWLPNANPSEDLVVPEEAEEAIAYNLAVQLAPEYGTAPTQVVTERAQGGLNDLLRDQAVATPIRPILSAPAAANYRSNTLNGSSWYNG